MRLSDDFLMEEDKDEITIILRSGGRLKITDLDSGIRITSPEIYLYPFIDPEASQKKTLPKFVDIRLDP